MATQPILSMKRRSYDQVSYEIRTSSGAERKSTTAVAEALNDCAWRNPLEEFRYSQTENKIHLQAIGARIIFLSIGNDALQLDGGSNMAKKPQVAAFATTESTAATVNPFAGLNLTTLAPKAKWGKGMSNEDRRAKLVAKLLWQKEVVAPGYCAPKTKGGKDKKEAWSMP
jgi:hypothetical protein